MSNEDRTAELLFGIPFVLTCVLIGTPIVIKGAGMSGYWIWLTYAVVGLLAAAMVIDQIRRACKGR